MSHQRHHNKARRGQATAIGIIYMTIALILITNFMYDVYKTQYAAIQRDDEKARELLDISNSFFGGTSTRYPNSTDPSHSTTLLSEIDQEYSTFQGTQGTIKTNPIDNMNFTNNRNGWIFKSTLGAIGVTASYISDEGDPTPGSGPGSIFSSLEGKNLGPYWLNWTYYFSYTEGEPLTSALSWSRKVANWTQITFSTLYVILDGPSPILPIILTSSIIDGNSPEQGSWVYQTNITVSTTAFTTSGSYNLTIALNTATNPGSKGNIKILFDDVGISMETKPGWSTDWTATTRLNEPISDITKLKLQYTGHYSGEQLSGSYTPDSGTLLGGTTSITGSYINLADKDSSYWQMRSYGTSTIISSTNPSDYTLLGSTALLSGSTSNLILNDGTYMAFRSYPSSTSTSYNPLGYSLFGSTTLIGGSVSDLTTNNGAYMTFRSYPTTSVTPYNPSGYSLLGSTSLIGGTVSDLTSNDASYMTFRSYPITTTASFNPSGYNLLGRTSLVSGSTSDLATHNGAYMILRSYISAYSTTTPTRATIAYKSNSGTSVTYPKAKTWSGTAWSGESELPNAGSTIRQTRIAYSTNSTRYYEKIAVALSDDGYLDAYVWNGASWVATNNIGFVGTTAAAYRPFDIAYEKTTGRAILVYGISSTDTTRDLAYKIWDGTNWSTEAYINDDGHTTDIQIYWVTLETKPTTGSNEIGLIFTDGTNSDVDAFIWNGAVWGNRHELTGTVSITSKEALTLAYEQTSGSLMIVAGEGSLIRWNRWTGSWGTSATFDINSGATGAMNWLTLKPDPVSNWLMLTSVDGSTDLCTSRWTGAAWTDITIHNTNVDTNAQRCADSDWEPSGSKALLVYGATNNYITIKIWSSGTGWSSTTNIGNSGRHPWIQLRRNPRDVLGDYKILGATLNNANSIFSFTWDGTTLAFTPTEITIDTVITTYECFEIGYQNFGDPSEYTVEAEFSGTSNTESWSQLAWTIGSSWTAASVSTTLQLYNYNTAQYSTSGDGYLSYTSSVTPNTYEEQTQTISTNPAYFRDASGNWKAKIKGFKTTSTQFDFNGDWIEYKPTWTTSYKSEVEFTGTSNLDVWTQLQWTLDSAWSIGSVSVTIQVYNYSSAGYPSSGAGYLAYTSSSTPNTDETQIQTISANPAYFRDGSGNWRIKVTGIKVGVTQFDSKIDWLEFKPTWVQSYNSEVELTGTSNTNTWTQLEWAIDSSWTTGSVSTTIQLYNYNLGAYPSSGDGYLTYSSSSTPNTDETKTQTITSNPTYFRDGSGNWKVKITGSKSGATQFDFKADWVEHKPSWITSYISEVEFTGTSDTYEWAQLDWSADTAWTTNDVSVTIQVYNYNLGNYPSAGDGYLSYTSSSTPNIDETKTQTISSNPENFRDGSGNWKVKITGTKSGATQFDFKADWIEHKNHHYNAYSTDWCGNFTITEAIVNITKLSISYWGYFSVDSVNQNMYIWNFNTHSWVLLDSTTYATAIVGLFQNKSATSTLASYINEGKISIRIKGEKTTNVKFHTFANYLSLKVYTSGSAAPTMVAQIISIWDYEVNQWQELSQIMVREIDLAQEPVEITESLPRYISPLGDVKIKIHGESENFIVCYADSLLTTDYYKDRRSLSLEIRNRGASNLDIVSIWVTNSTLHQRLSLNQVITLAPGEEYIYSTTSLGYFTPGRYEVKVTTRRGNIANYIITQTG